MSISNIIKLFTDPISFSFRTLIRRAEELKLENQNLSSIFDLARAKLTCTKNIDGPYDSFSTAAKLVIIDVRSLMLDYEPRRVSHRVDRRYVTRDSEKQMVASNMRIVPQHREYIRSGYPSGADHCRGCRAENALHFAPVISVNI